MAKINPVKLKQDADKLEKAGKLDQAIALLKQVVDDNPRDWNIVKKIGDLYVRLNKMREAMVEYQKVADFYAKDGFHLKAIAIWKQINKLDATALEPYVNLAELYGKQGLLMEAKSQYQYVVDEYLKRGKNRDAGDVLKKMADIDPADLKVRSKLADLYTRDGNIGQGGGRAHRHRGGAEQEGPPRGGPAGAREGAEDRPQERAHALRAGARPSRPEELRQGRALPGGRGQAVAQRRRAALPPRRGLPGQQEGRGGGGDLQAPARRSTPTARTRACRWAAST